ACLRNSPPSSTGRSAMVERALSAPAAAGAVPAPRQTLGDQDLAQGPPVALDRAKLAAVAVLVAAAAVDELKRPRVDQLQQPVCRALAEGEFRLAFVLISLGRIDVFEPDLQPGVVDRVAIDHALCSVLPAAQRELASSGGREPARCRENVEPQPLFHKDRNHDTDKDHQT